MRKNWFQIFVIMIILILIGVLIYFSEKRKNDFELAQNEAKKIMKLINQAGEQALEAEKARPEPVSYGVFFNFEKAILFADENKNKAFDDEIISEYQLHENVKLNAQRIVYYIPHTEQIEFCDQTGQCFDDNHPTVQIADIKTGRALEFRFTKRNGKIELQEVVDQY